MHLFHMRKTIRLPHLGFAIFIRPRPKKWTAYASCLTSKDGYSCLLYLPKGATAPAVAHELMHVIQHIVKRFNMDIYEESEHTAYIMQYALQEIMQGRKTVR